MLLTTLLFCSLLKDGNLVVVSKAPVAKTTTRKVFEAFCYLVRACAVPVERGDWSGVRRHDDDSVCYAMRTEPLTCLMFSWVKKMLNPIWYAHDLGSHL